MDTATPAEALTQEILVRLGDRYATMFVRIWRPSGTPRATVFCLHGFTGNGADFDYLATFLCRNGFLVVCPDLLGRGRSAYLGSGYDMNVYSKCLRALGEFAGTENHFIGTSWGGTILLLFLQMTRSKAARIILNDVPMIGGPNIDAMRDEVLKESTLAFETRAMAKDYLSATRAVMGPIEDTVFNRYVENRIATGPRGFRLAYDPATTGNFGALAGREYDLFPIAAKIDARILLMYGRGSQVIERQIIERTRLARPDLWLVDNIDAGEPPSLMTLDQALLILGFLSAA
ncbi:MAG: alpha/beta hydrolase [Mesorhizobium sp.]|uniref:alpha/beta fold hydrolase n=2 Tax=Mesorhizobium TaxID=68287 RepID=UPI000FCC15BB|nr:MULTISPECIES: alpha/beta fold hydrolase [unclassified Mesorhizobium]RUU60433.1 alpha/beta fold hydrolase [Mesorhizobium sp. M7A.T.Ca.TU.009.01.1.1]RUU83822.1 alpha/beta fold hydrolase [Mesorhizobium sp. M7A.T.Ca.TU.009.01.1.2]RUT81612.1 alpha/beta fold hydrolase [Mesorhizobium sp. M7A.T.Ca.US.000.02.1.1]RUT82814.1 alpha/beta fold hydrolase [Mesorhizobium sp. M7A.T.Ca.US.000.02.2.1]RUV37241.1 alpha/beta fold hydrolase [Mesorhizobium sp. M7A.F.Ca.MR.148.00.0.0]